MNGKCYCTSSLMMNVFGQCSVCQAVGCKSCSSSNTQCIECIDDEAQLVNGECLCVYNATLHNNTQLDPTTAYQPNYFGFCDFCSVLGCRLCTQDAAECYLCKDSRAVLSNGKCTCPSNYFLDTDGICKRTCVVLYCSTCVVGYPSKCKTCNSTFTLTSNSTC